MSYSDLTLQERLDIQLAKLGEVLEKYNQLCKEGHDLQYRCRGIEDMIQALEELKGGHDTGKDWLECYSEDAQRL